MITQNSSPHPRARASLSVLGVVERERRVLRPSAPSVLVTIESAIAEVDGGRGEPMTLDRAGILVLPRGARVTVQTSSPASRLAMIALHEPLLASMVRAYRKLGAEREPLDRWLSEVSLLPRTIWVHEIVHRYVFERTVLDAHDNLTTRFLETELAKEVYFLFRDRDAGADRATAVRRHSPAVDRAIAYIEARLFDPCDVPGIASHVGASEASLLRWFRRDVGCAPGAYWRNRKLDEALVLVRAGSHSLGEIATRIGYGAPTAFAFAFRRRFGRPPSAFLPRRPVRPAP